MSDENRSQAEQDILRLLKQLGMDEVREEEAEEVTGVASFVRPIFGWKGRVALYRLSPPLRQVRYDEENEAKSYEYVFVSAVTVLDEPETYIFPAEGPAAEMPVNSREMRGSYRGGLSHIEALKRAGYAIERESNE